MAAKNKKNPIKELEQYIAFLEKQQGSKNYKSRVSPDEYAKQQDKLKKARLRLKLLKPK